MRRMAIVLVLSATAGPWAATSQAEEYDVVVYGGTSAGVTAAVQAARMGKKVVLIDPGDYVGTNPDGSARYVSHLGGLSSGGLGATDVGDGSAIGGLSYEFYQREDALGGGSGWNVHAGKAEQVYDSMVSEAGVQLDRLEYLDRNSGVSKTGNRIDSITTLSGKTYSGSMFIDATYEGDLMAAAGVSYTVGREARSEYGESYNGIAYDQTREHVFGGDNVDPYVTPGDPDSGLIQGVHLADEDPRGNGASDGRIQAYCYRMTWTDGAGRTKWTDLWSSAPPEGYDRSRYEVHDRYIKEGNNLGDVVRLDTGIGGNKNDINNWGPASTDFIGGNYDVYVPATGNTVNYAEANKVEREYITQKHIEYTKGYLYYLAFDAPSNIRNSMNNWGLASDEFTDNGNFPHQLYVREARRMVGEYVMTEANCRDQVVAPNAIGLGAYPMDSHNTHRYIDSDGYVEAEGNFWLGGIRETYEIDYGTITPKNAEAGNLLVPAAVSASHTAFGSMRMEPVFMVLGQSAATAAVAAMDEGVDVQNINFAAYQALMRAYGQKLTENDEPTPGPFNGMLREDFNYGPSDNDLETVSYIKPGFAEPWDANWDDPKYRSGKNLTYTGAGYTNTVTPDWLDSGGAADATGSRSGHITERAITGGMAGDIWLTTLVRQENLNAGEEALLWLDRKTSDGTGDCFIGINEAGELALLHSGNAAEQTDGTAHLAGQTHLLLAKLSVVDGQDSIEVWIDPDVGHLGSADLSASLADLFGDAIDGIGMSVGGSGGVLDAIRMSNEDSAFIDVLGLLRGDVNLDMVVDSDDGEMFRDNYGMTSGAEWGDGDFDQDGDVDFRDAWTLMQHYSGPADGGLTMSYLTKGAVPEPATMGLLAIGAVGLLARRRRI